MLTESGPKALEYNARFGDPETQTVLPLLKCDLADIMVACIEKRLHEVQLIMYSRKSCAVVIISSQGYPGPYHQGDRVTMKPLGETCVSRISAFGLC
jgi:phosphoribosylamine--glycine ligase